MTQPTRLAHLHRSQPPSTLHGVGNVLHCGTGLRMISEHQVARGARFVVSAVRRAVAVAVLPAI